jgi:hypothetical protein
MCEGRYEEYGRPSIVNAKTLAAAALVCKVYEFSCGGGNLHIVLDDWNLEDDNIEFCSRQIANGGYEGRDSAEELAVERECCDAFAAMTMDERASALALYDSYLAKTQSQ